MTKWITNPKKIDTSYIESEVNLGYFIIVQFDEINYNDKILQSLNELAGKLNSNFQIRFYGHDKQTLDCKTLLKINHVKNLSINCLKKVKNLTHLSKLSQLEKLIIGIDEFNETEVLNYDNLKNLVELNINTLKIKNLNLDYLKKYTKLKLLAISGNHKNIESIGTIESLETLNLSSIPHKISFEFVNKLKKLKHLHISFGSRDNIDELTIESLETLTILWVKNLNSLTNLSRFKNLKYFNIENQAKIESIEFNTKMKSLTKLGINNCKGMSKLDLHNLVALKTLIISRSLKLNFENIINQKLPSTLKHINVYTGRKNLDKEIKNKIKQLGYTTT